MMNGFEVLRGFALAALVSLGGCATLPGDGPNAMDIAFHKAETIGVPNTYVMVQLDALALEKINAFAPLSFPSEFRTMLGGTRATTVGVGDRLIVNIWEPSQDGVFATSENKQATLRVVVDEDGKIYIPYAGRIQAAGRKVETLRQAIEAGLAGTAVEPQVQVLLEDNQANSVVVVGDVSTPGQLPIPIRGLRLMEAVARAGGTREATYETVATVSRGGRTGTVRLDEVVNVPANNIWLAPGDNVLVLHQPRTYSAFGAVKTSGLVPFKTETVSLTEALAQVGGLIDVRADAGGVFLLRFESRQLAQWLIETGQGSGVLDAYSQGVTPVIYRLDFTDPNAFFLAQGLKMRDKDVIYVANHPTAELSKFLNTIVAPIIGTARNTAALVN